VAVDTRGAARGVCPWGKSTFGDVLIRHASVFVITC
jgi:hypothetical protein